LESKICNFVIENGVKEVKEYIFSVLEHYGGQKLRKNISLGKEKFGEDDEQ
jgi:hypothetical protein